MLTTSRPMENGTSKNRYCVFLLFIAILSSTISCRTLQDGGNLIATAGANQGMRVGNLDSETLQRLALSIGKSGQAKPGDTLAIQLGTNECCYYFEPVLADVSWSVTPETGATIDPISGILKIDASVEHGAVYTVTADIEHGRKMLIGTVTVFRSEDNPLVGVWHEKFAIACDGQQIPENQEILRELVFHADGSFQATFTPFEIYHDYWGTYHYDPTHLSITFEVTEGNYIPENLDLDGRYKIENGALELDNVWLGRKASNSVTGCGHFFTK